MPDTSDRLRRPGRLAFMLATVLAATLMAALGAHPFAQEDRGGGKRFTATAIDIGTRGPQDLPKVGYFKTPERVVLATDRYIRFWEVARGSRTTDYPFTIIELRLNGDGRGEGKMSVATKIIADKKNNEVVLENWGTQPVLLKDVRRER